jgi:methylated-DNA-protein-cysteine methyltransferase related protein
MSPVFQTRRSSLARPELCDNGHVDERKLEQVLLAVELVPRGRVVSYGDLGQIVGIGPRLVGNIMSREGSAVPWWRVTNASGDFPAHLRDEVRPHWAEEGILWKSNGAGCRIRDYRADLDALARDLADQWAQVMAEQPHSHRAG